MTETILEIKNLKKSYGENQVLKDISLTVHKGEVSSIIGSSDPLTFWKRQLADKFSTAARMSWTRITT